MKIIEKIQSTLLTPKVTGYSAVAALGLTIYSGISKNKNLKKHHKMLSYGTAALTTLHIGLIEYYHYKYKKNCGK